jgi:3-oxoacyl-[acyl-carrier-protein] synthase-3
MIEGNPSHVHWEDRRSVRLLGMGSAFPGRQTGTVDLLDRIYAHYGVDIRRQGVALAKRLGVRSRYLCRDFLLPQEAPRSGDTNAQLAARAVRGALEESRMAPEDLSYLIGHTTTPGSLLPPNIAEVADLIGYRGPFVELRQACTGFANALVMAFGLLHSPRGGPVAIVGSETGSVFFDPRRATENSGQLVNLLQMGDAASACILAPDGSDTSSRLSNVYYGHLGGGLDPAFRLTDGGSDRAHTPNTIAEFEHDPRSARERGTVLFGAGMRAVEGMGFDRRALDFFIPHQANGCMAEPLAGYLGVPQSRVFVNADRLGNTGSAAIWLALAELRTSLSSGTTVCVLGAEAWKYMYGGFVYAHG